MLLIASWPSIIIVRLIPSAWIGRPLMVLFSLFTLAFFWTLMSPYPLMISRWVSFGRSKLLLQAFRLMCDMLRLCPTHFTFLHYYTSHPSDPVSWFSLINRSGNILFAPSHPRTRVLRENFSRFLKRPRVGSSFFTSSGGLNFLCIGPRPIPASSNGLVLSVYNLS